MADRLTQSCEEPRRSFLAKSLAILIGGLLSLFPFATGVVVFLDPLRKRRKRGSNGDVPEGLEGYIRVSTLDALLVGSPRREEVIDDLSDAWNLYPQEAIGAVYLLRTDESTVQAFNVSCPHVTCPVDFDANRKVYQCPCHDSSFNVDGSIANERSPAARGLDSLEVKQVPSDAGVQIWVKYQDFRAGIKEKIVKE